MQLFAPIQLISFWFHEICMGYQQALGRELWFPGDVARYGGGIQIMHCSKLAPRVFSLLHCSKNSVMAIQLKSFRLWNSKIRTTTHLKCSFGLWTLLFLNPGCNNSTDPKNPLLTRRCIPVASWWMEHQVKWTSTATVVISLCANGSQH